MQINDFLWSTGQMKGSAWFGTIHDQSLAIIQNDFIYLLTGCAHPGIVKIVERTINYLPDKRIDLIIARKYHKYLSQITKGELYDGHDNLCRLENE